MDEKKDGNKSIGKRIKEKKKKAREGSSRKD